MAVYNYKAIDFNDVSHQGTIAADSPKTAREQIRAQGFKVIESFQETKQVNRPAWLLARSRKNHQVHVVNLARELSTLLAVGIPLLQAIDTVIKQTKGRFHQELLILRDKVAAGTCLSESMRQQPNVFDDLVVTLVEVGEASGRLDAVLNEFVNFREKSLAFKDRVSSAMLYPLIVSAVGIGVAIFLMTFVVPQLINGLTKAGQELPQITIFVKAISDLIITQWPWLFIGAAGITVTFVSVLNHPKGRHKWHQLLIAIPLVGELIRKQSVVQIAIVLATLLRSGLPFVRGLEVAQTSARNTVIQKALAKCQQTITAGGDIAKALEDSKAFTPTVVQVFAVGQASGQLENMLERLAQDYDQQVQTATNRLTALLEPALIIALAIGIGIIAFATILPILEAGNVF